VTVSASTPQNPGSSDVVGDYSSGYILSPAGLTLGLTAANTAPFPALDLTWNDRTSASGFNSGYADWNPVPATLTLNGSSGVGTVLTDSGVDYMLLTPAPGTNASTNGACTAGKDCLAPGSSVTVAIGTIMSYSFTIGPDAGAPLQPAPLAAPAYAVKDIGSEVFVNTGVSFFDEYAYLYDYVNGQVGYLAMAPGPLPLLGVSSAFGWSRRLRQRLAPRRSHEAATTDRSLVDVPQPALHLVNPDRLATAAGGIQGLYRLSHQRKAQLRRAPLLWRAG
jgi:hypothetical protein